MRVYVCACMGVCVCVYVCVRVGVDVCGDVLLLAYVRCESYVRCIIIYDVNHTCNVNRSYLRYHLFIFMRMIARTSVCVRVCENERACVRALARTCVCVGVCA